MRVFCHALVVIYTVFTNSSAFANSEDVDERCVGVRDGEVIESSENKIASAEISDHVGFCSNHASRDLLHQELCRIAKNEKGCFQPAVMDFLALDAKLPKRNSTETLREILKRGTITEESCLKLNDLFTTAVPKDFVGSYQEKFQAATKEVAIVECQFQYKLYVSSGGKGNPPPCNDPMYSAVEKRKRVKSCPERQLPQLFIRNSPYNKDGLSPEENLNKILASGRQTKVAITGPHALVISNFRKICSSGKMKLQYQTLDSLYGTRWSNARKPGDWVDGNTILQRLLPNDVFTTVEESGGNAIVAPATTRAAQ